MTEPHDAGLKRFEARITILEQIAEIAFEELCRNLVFRPLRTIGRKVVAWCAKDPVTSMSFGSIDCRCDTRSYVILATG